MQGKKFTDLRYIVQIVILLIANIIYAKIKQTYGPLSNTSLIAMAVSTLIWVWLSFDLMRIEALDGFPDLIKLLITLIPTLSIVALGNILATLYL